MPHIMGDYLPHPPVDYGVPPGLPFEPPPPEILPPDPGPWIDTVIPPEDVDYDEPEGPPITVIEPVEVPPTIKPPPPDITPPTIVPPPLEDPIPPPMPVDGILPTTFPPPSVITIGGEEGVGTFMVYVGKRLVLTMAAAVGTVLGKSAGAMLLGVVQKQLFRGASIRFHSGRSPGSYSIDTPHVTRTLGYVDAWRGLPQEFSYWEK